jgi:cytochrome c5
MQPDWSGPATAFGGPEAKPYNPRFAGAGPTVPHPHGGEDTALSAEQDRKFFDTFMLVLGILVVITIAIFVLANSMAGRTQEVHVKEDPAYQQRNLQRIRPVGQVAIAGADNSGLRDPGGPRMAAAAPAATAQPAKELSGEEVYKGACTACHGAGIAGAPKTGDAAAWAPRVAQGMDTLVTHAIEGFQGQAGYMPPRGGFANLTDQQVRDAVQYMVDRLPE